MVLFPIDYSDRKEIGRTGERVSAIGLGTWSIRSYDNALKVFLRAVENGIDNIDTAEIYDAGRAEEFVGRLARIVGRERSSRKHYRRLGRRRSLLIRSGTVYCTVSRNTGYWASLSGTM